jgi:hypothetical protein
MVIAAKTPRIEIDDVDPVYQQPGWHEIQSEVLSSWNATLLKTDASFMQFPYWNEACRYFYFRPHYLLWNQNGTKVYACVLSLGPPLIGIALVFRGPVSMLPNQTVPREALTDLCDWARRRHYVFIRFSHQDERLLSCIANVGNANRIDAFPFYQDAGATAGEFVVRQEEQDIRTAANFDREARRKIRRASEAGYELRTEESTEGLVRVWHLFLASAIRKEFRIERPLKAYEEMVERASQHDCVRIYVSSLNGLDVGATLVFRDRKFANCILAGFDLEHSAKKCSPAVLLHWWSMRNMYRRYRLDYNMGLGSGSVAQFKKQFSPQLLAYPAPVTVILNKFLYSVWSVLILPFWRALRPLVRLYAARRCNAEPICQPMKTFVNAKI